jgi:hypothetical protein
MDRALVTFHALRPQLKRGRYATSTLSQRCRSHLNSTIFPLFQIVGFSKSRSTQGSTRAVHLSWLGIRHFGPTFLRAAFHASCSHWDKYRV